MPFGDWFTIGAIYSLEYTYDFSATIDDSEILTIKKPINKIQKSNIGLGMREDGILRYGIASLLEKANGYSGFNKTQ